MVTSAGHLSVKPTRRPFDICSPMLHSRRSAFHPVVTGDNYKIQKSGFKSLHGFFIYFLIHQLDTQCSSALSRAKATNSQPARQTDEDWINIVEACTKLHIFMHRQNTPARSVWIKEDLPENAHFNQSRIVSESRRWSPPCHFRAPFVII